MLIIQLGRIFPWHLESIMNLSSRLNVNFVFSESVRMKLIFVYDFDFSNIAFCPEHQNKIFKLRYILNFVLFSELEYALNSVFMK